MLQNILKKFLETKVRNDNFRKIQEANPDRKIVKFERIMRIGKLKLQAYSPDAKRYKVVLHRTWQMIDGGSGGVNNAVNIPAGEYILIELPNPFGYPNTWYVVEDTLCGCSAKYWRDWPMDVFKEDGWGIEIEEIV